MLAQLPADQLASLPCAACAGIRRREYALQEAAVELSVAAEALQEAQAANQHTGHCV